MNSARPDLRSVHPVILCGGTGRRLRPISTPARPKPFLRDMTGRSLLQRTLDRTRVFAPCLIVCNAAHADMVRADIAMTGCDVAGMVCEPAGRNTGPAIIAAARVIERRHGTDAMMIVMPSDHAMDSCDPLYDAVSVMADVLDDRTIGVFGITPTAPESRYGYIRLGDKALHEGAYHVAQFAEKPDRARAAQWIAEGGWYWNSGLYMARAGAILDVACRVAPDMARVVIQSVDDAVVAGDVLTLGNGFAESPKQSFDVAIMERAGGGVVVPLTLGWSDLGTWAGLGRAVFRHFFPVQRAA